MSLKGKKVLCFIALSHHNRFLVPIMQTLAAAGMESHYFTAPAESALEITLNQAGLEYIHTTDYADESLADFLNAEMRVFWPVFWEKMESTPALQMIPVIINSKDIRNTAEIYHCIKRMIEVEKPDVLFALHEINPWGKMMGHLSHECGIPFFTLQEGLYYGDAYIYRYHTDYSTACVVWGQDCREVLLRSGCADDKIYPLGNSHIWHIKQTLLNDNKRQQTYKELGIAAGKKIVLFLMSYYNYAPLELEPYFRWAKAQKDVVTVFKWHPMSPKSWVEIATSKIKHLPNVVSTHDFDTYALLSATAVCVLVGNSTTGLEALALGKPLVEVRLPGQHYSFAERGVADLIEGLDDYAKFIEAALKGEVSAERAAAIEAYLAHNLAYRDDHVLDRMVALVDEAVSARALLRNRPALTLAAPGDTAQKPCTLVLPVDDCAAEVLLQTLEALAELPSHLYDAVIIDCAADANIKALLAELGREHKLIKGEVGWSYSDACNRAAEIAQGKYLALMKPGILPAADWLETLLQTAADQPQAGVLNGLTVDGRDFIWHMGVAFEGNNAPYSLYQLLPAAALGAPRMREFRAIEGPFLVATELFCRLGGFSPHLRNRFHDIDFCLRAREAGFTVLHTSFARATFRAPSWLVDSQDQTNNRIRFFSAWVGSLWQDDPAHLAQDGLTHETLALAYREFANLVAQSAQAAQPAAETVSHA